jgi:hypothetical protein
MNHPFSYLQKHADQAIEVLQDLPMGNFQILQWNREKTAEEIDLVELSFRNFYYCRCCDGWIEGHMKIEYVNNIQPMALAGRQGTALVCRRCNYEISFSGMVS